MREAFIFLFLIFFNIQVKAVRTIPFSHVENDPSYITAYFYDVSKGNTITGEVDRRFIESVDDKIIFKKDGQSSFVSKKDIFVSPSIISKALIDGKKVVVRNPDFKNNFEYELSAISLNGRLSFLTDKHGKQIIVETVDVSFAPVKDKIHTLGHQVNFMKRGYSLYLEPKANIYLRIRPDAFINIISGDMNNMTAENIATIRYAAPEDIFISGPSYNHKGLSLDALLMTRGHNRWPDRYVLAFNPFTTDQIISYNSKNPLNEFKVESGLRKTDVRTFGPFSKFKVGNIITSNLLGEGNWKIVQITFSELGERVLRITNQASGEIKLVDAEFDLNFLCSEDLKKLL
jgi:hypothetical protein